MITTFAMCRLVPTRPSLALLVAITGCVSRAYETETVVRIGYPEPPPTMLVVLSNDPVVAAQLEQRVRAIAPMYVTSRQAVTSESGLQDATVICRAAQAQPPDTSPPADVLVVLQASVGAEDKYDCTDHEWTGSSGTFNPSKGWVNDTRRRECVSSEYSHAEGRALARVTVLDRLTCTPRATVETSTDEYAPGAIAASGTQEENQVRVIAAARTAITPKIARLDGSDLLPPGVHAVQHDTHAELRGSLSRTLRAGRTYALRGTRDATTEYLGWLHLDAATENAAAGTLSARVEINDEAPLPKLPILQVGDRIERLTHAHRWTGLPLVGVTRTDRGGDLTSLSGAVALRWTYPRWFVHSNFLLAGHASRHTLRHQESISFGPWLPIGGRLALLGSAELGLQSLHVHSWTESGFVGLGVGLEVWAGKTMFVLDVRHRWEEAVAADLDSIVDARSWMVLFGIAGGTRNDRPPQ